MASEYEKEWRAAQKRAREADRERELADKEAAAHSHRIRTTSHY